MVIARSPKVLISLMGYTPEDNGAQATRAISLFNEIKKCFPDTYLLMRRGDKSDFVERYILIQPWIKIQGKLILLKGILFRAQMTLSIIKFIHNKNVTSVILRGHDTIALFPFLKFQKIKIFYDYHGRYHLELNQQNRPIRAKIIELCDKIILNLADKIIVVSEGIQEQIPEYQHKCLYLQNGVDVQLVGDAKWRKPVIDIPDREYIVGFIGNWEPVMRIDDICDAVENIDNTSALIIGKGYDSNSIFSKYQNNKKVIFTGRISQIDALRLLHRMNICIIPYDNNHYMSKIKNFFSNRKIYEYISAGKPIILSNIEAKPRFLIENINCLTYQPGNVSDLARKIFLMKSNTSLAEKMSKNNLELAKNYNWESIVQDSGILNELKQNL